MSSPDEVTTYPACVYTLIGEVKQLVRNDVENGVGNLQVTDRTTRGPATPSGYLPQGSRVLTHIRRPTLPAAGPTAAAGGSHRSAHWAVQGVLFSLKQKDILTHQGGRT